MGDGKENGWVKKRKKKEKKEKKRKEKKKRTKRKKKKKEQKERNGEKNLRFEPHVASQKIAAKIQTKIAIALRTTKTCRSLQPNNKLKMEKDFGKKYLIKKKKKRRKK